MQSKAASWAFGLVPPHSKGGRPRRTGDLKAVPQDLFVERPLKFERRGSGFLLYSVGPDRKDDNGKPGFSGDGDIVMEVKE